VFGGIEREAEGLRNGDGVSEIEVRLVVERLALVVAIAAAGFALEADLVGVLVDVRLEPQLGSACLEGGAADHVDTAGEARRHVGRGDLVDFHALGVAEGEGLEESVARRAAGPGSIHIVAVERDVGVVGGQAAEPDLHGVHLIGADIHAGKKLHEFAQVVLDDVAEGIGGEHGLEAGAEPLLVDRD
jgi:hypothetical protein